MTTPESQQREFIREAASAKGPYGDAQPLETEHSLLGVRVTGEADPNLPSRILDVLTIRGDLPLRFDLARDVQTGMVTVRFAVLADEVPFPQQMVDRILKIPSVVSANLMANPEQ